MDRETKYKAFWWFCLASFIIFAFVWACSKNTHRQTQYDFGRECGLGGIPETACPYSWAVDREMWLKGWIEVYKKLKDK